MTVRDDSVYLDHILEAVQKIESYVQNVDEPTFTRTSLIQDAVIRQFQIIGEAVKRLSTQTRDLSPDTPWSEFARFRDKLIHQYFGIDVSIVWQTIETDLPQVKTAVQQLRRSGTGSNSA